MARVSEIKTNQQWVSNFYLYQHRKKENMPCFISIVTEIQVLIIAVIWKKHEQEKLKKKEKDNNYLQLDLNVVQPKIVWKFPEARCVQN